MKQEQSNFNQHKQSDNINTYTYCWKCLKKLTTPSPTPFCSWECKKMYYQEIKKENDALFGEWVGGD